jgi:hypothetical protein
MRKMLVFGIGFFLLGCGFATVRPFEYQKEIVYVYNDNQIADTATVYLSNLDTTIGANPYYKFYVKKNDGSFILLPQYISYKNHQIRNFYKYNDRSTNSVLFDFTLKDTARVGNELPTMYYINQREDKEKGIIYTFYYICELHNCPSYSFEVSEKHGIIKISVIGSAVLYQLMDD